MKTALAFLASTVFGLTTIPSMSYAQMTRTWPLHKYLDVGLIEDDDRTPMCAVATSDNSNTFAFSLVQKKCGVGIYFSAKALHAIEAPAISFFSDGFQILSVPVRSSFKRLGAGQMGNSTITRPDANQWSALWQVFRQSGIVTASAAFIDAPMPTEGFVQAEADFSPDRRV